MQPDYEDRKQTNYTARVPDLVEKWSPRLFYTTAAAGWVVVALLAWWHLAWSVLAVPVLVYTWMGVVDRMQQTHAVRRNYPVLGRFRYMLEGLRNELRQYFLEADDEENPISREKRATVYARAKNQLDTLPFGTRRDAYGPGYEWVNHSLNARAAGEDEVRVRIGEHSSCSRPYDASLFNVSAMSFGSLSSHAILALSHGAKAGGFYHNTGEGGISPYHLEGGADLVWQIGTGYFGCRDEEGNFDEELYRKNSRREQVKMIELKLSQGAKPGHGGILPARKVSQEIAEIRHVPLGRDVVSPPAHTTFTTPVEMLHFIERLRTLSDGKPVGFKICIGNRTEFMGIVKAMEETGILPDFITVDGGEGGTGAAPLEFSNSVGSPLVDGLVFVNGALIGAGLRDRLKIISAGKITSGFHILRMLALGADLTNGARSMMFAVGCIQALKCNTNHCPVGVTTQDPVLVSGLVVEDKMRRVTSFHRKTVESVYELLGAAGIGDPGHLRPHHILRRCDDGVVMSYEELYPTPAAGSLLEGNGPEHLQKVWDEARTDRFGPGLHAA